MRMNLKLMRVKHGMTQDEVAARTNVSRPTYAAIENGSSSGKDEFWKNVQSLYFVADEQMWELMQND